MGMPPMIEQLASYNLWANIRFTERALHGSEDLIDREVSSSFPSLRATLLHIRDAENAWMHRLEGLAPVPWPAEADRSIETLPKYSTRLRDLVLGKDEDWLLGTVAYHDLRGNTHEQVRWQMLLHCFNHGTQHRGQLITMMRTLGMDGIPANDLVVYQRTLKK